MRIDRVESYDASEAESALDQEERNGFYHFEIRTLHPSKAQLADVEKVFLDGNGLDGRNLNQCVSGTRLVIDSPTEDTPLYDSSEVDPSGVGDTRSFALMHPDSSHFNFMNDKAFRNGCTREEYLQRCRTENHAVFRWGLETRTAGTYGLKLYVEFFREAKAGEEVFATYGADY